MRLGGAFFRAVAAAVGALGLALACSANDEGLYEPTASGGTGGTPAAGGTTPSGGSAVGGGGTESGGAGAGGTGASGGAAGAEGGSGGAGAGGDAVDAGAEAGDDGGSGEVPDGGADAALACDPGAALCVGDVATTCAVDGSGPVAGGTDCTLQSATCESGVCVPNCAVGAAGCGCGGDAGCGTGLYCAANNLCATLSPVAHWAFEDDFVDSTGNGYDGVEQTSLAFTDGVVGRAVTIDRSNGDYVEIDSFATTFKSIIDGFTLFIRVRLNNYSTDQVHVLFGLGSPGEQTSDNEFRFIFENGVVLETETGNGDNHLASLGAIPSLGVWHEYVFVVSGTTVDYYLDGALVSQTSFTATDSTSSRMVIGSWQDAHTLEGDIDDVKVFDSPLDAAAIATLWGN